jgi:hypothetical protein
MKRDLFTERTFFLGQFKNIKVGDTFTDIPEEFIYNKEFISNIRLLQLLQIDEVYFKYAQLSPTFMENISTEDALSLINEAKINTIEQLKEATASKKQGDE